MPTYDYLCGNCEHKFEKFQSITANPSKKCPSCGKLKLNRLIGAGAGVIFKGSGFYETDYRDKSYTDAASKDKPASDDSSTDKKETKKDAVKTDSSKKSEKKSNPKKKD